MSVYKEGFKFIETIEKNSINIYPDACDNGMPVNKDDQTWNNCKSIIETYKINGTRKEYGTAPNLTVSNTIMLVDEWNPPHKEYKFKIEYIQCTTGACKGFDGFISVYMIK